LDELYDLTARFPDPDTIRLTSLIGDPQSRTTPNKRVAKPPPLRNGTTTEDEQDKYVAKLSLMGITTDDDKVIDTLMKRFVEDSHSGVDPKFPSPNTGADRTRFRQQFPAHVRLEKPPPDKYPRRLPADDGAPDERSRRRNNNRRQNPGRGRQ